MLAWQPATQQRHLRCVAFQEEDFNCFVFGLQGYYDAAKVKMSTLNSQVSR